MTARDDIAKVLHDHGLCVEVNGHRRNTPACLSYADALLASPALAHLLNEARAEGWEQGFGSGMTYVVGVHEDDATNPYRKDTP